MPGIIPMPKPPVYIKNSLTKRIALPIVGSLCLLGALWFAAGGIQIVLAVRAGKTFTDPWGTMCGLYLVVPLFIIFLGRIGVASLVAGLKKEQLKRG